MPPLPPQARSADRVGLCARPALAWDRIVAYVAFPGPSSHTRGPPLPVVAGYGRWRGGWPHLHRRPALLASTHPLHLAPASPRGPAKPRASPYTYAAISRRITQAALSRRRRGDGPPNRRRHPPRGAPSYAMRHGAATALQTAGATPPPQPCPPFRAGRSRSLCGANAIRSHYAAEHGGGRIRRRQPWTADRRRRSGRTAAGMSRQGARALADRRRTATPAWCMGRAYARAASAPRLRRSPRCAPASGPQPWPPGRRQNAKSANVKK